MFCKYCGQPISDDAQYCPYCKKELHHDPYVHDTAHSHHKPLQPWQLLSLFGSFLLFITIFLPFFTITTPMIIINTTKVYTLFDTAYGLYFLLLSVLCIILALLRQKIIIFPAIGSFLLTLYVIFSYDQVRPQYIYATKGIAFYLMFASSCLLLTGGILAFASHAKRDPEGPLH